jgi:hypothetical protein
MKGILAASLVSLVLSCPGSAQAPAGAEARLKALNITLPPDAAPAANFVNSVQTGKLLFLSGNTAGPAWAGKGKLGKDLTVEQGREAARQPSSQCANTIRVTSSPVSPSMTTTSAPFLTQPQTSSTLWTSRSASTRIAR